MKKNAKFYCLVMMLGFALPGCRTAYIVPVAQDTSRALCGNIKLYGTTNVPFEYEELSVVAIMYDGMTQDACLSDFIATVQKLGADAVLNFSLDPTVDSEGFWLVIDDCSRIRVKGVAVKIKRP